MSVVGTLHISYVCVPSVLLGLLRVGAGVVSDSSLLWGLFIPLGGLVQLLYEVMCLAFCDLI